jgi:hypothetical protein
MVQVGVRLMARVVADSALKNALSSNGDLVAICDESGRVIGFAVSSARFVANGADPYDAEEMRASLTDPRCYTTEQVLQMLDLN